MADTKSNKRARNWCAVVYPESAPKDWKEKLDSLNLKWACSPLHDKDCDDDGVIKKAHWHIVICYPGNKSFDQVCADLAYLNCPIPQICRDVNSSLRYFIHLDHPHKYQYDKRDIEGYGGFDVEEAFTLSKSSKRQVLREVFRYIRENNIEEYCDLVDACDELCDDGKDDWFTIVTENYTLAVKEYIKSRRFKNNRQ